MFVNLLVMSMCCAETDELIKMFGMWTRERRLGLGNHYYVRPPDRWGHRRRKGSVVGGTMASAEHKPITSGLGAEPTTTNLSYRKQYALLRSTATGVRVGGPRVHGAPTSSLGGYA